MNKIEVKILNPEVIAESSKMMVCAARLTQKGHAIQNMDDFMELYNKPFTDKTVGTMVHLPHPTIQKFGVVNLVVVGSSRRVLAQLTRHQNEVKFMSASLQYSTYGTSADFVVPYNILAAGECAKRAYLQECRTAMDKYKFFNEHGVDNDSCGYMAPQGLRNILIISATPYQLKHMIAQRICRRNTLETRYVMLKIWEQLYALDPVFFSPDTTGPFCMQGPCKEGKMGCANPIEKFVTPTDILRKDFPLIYENSNV